MPVIGPTSGFRGMNRFNPNFRSSHRRNRNTVDVPETPERGPGGNNPSDQYGRAARLQSTLLGKLIRLQDKTNYGLTGDPYDYRQKLFQYIAVIAKQYDLQKLAVMQQEANKEAEAELAKSKLHLAA